MKKQILKLTGALLVLCLAATGCGSTPQSGQPEEMTFDDEGEPFAEGEEERDFSRPLTGSRNQVFHFLTGRIRPEEMKEAGNRVELRISPQGLLSGNGMGGLLAEAKLRQLYGAPAAGGSGEDGQEGPEGTEHERNAEDGAHGI